MICDKKQSLLCLYSDAIVSLYCADVQLKRLQATADLDEYDRLFDLRREGHRILDQVRATLENHILKHGCGDLRPGTGAKRRTRSVTIDGLLTAHREQCPSNKD